MTGRKTSEQIKRSILNKLKEGPTPVEKLRKEIDSNWSTINNYLQELKDEGEVREVTIRNNLKFYIKKDYPVFYGLPLDKKTLNDSLFLLNTIANTWEKEKGETINKTTMQKIAVEIIYNYGLDIPVLKFHYGKTLPLSIEPSQSSILIKEYNVNPPKNSTEIEKFVQKEVKEGEHVNIAWKEKLKQYKSHKDMKLYLFSDNVSYEILKGKKDDKDHLLNLFYNILLEIPSSEEYSYIFEKYHDFVNAVNFIFNTKEFEIEENRKNLLKEILDTFNSIWDLLTIEFYFNDFKKNVDENFSELQETIKQMKIDFSLFNIEDKLGNLLDYKKSLNPKKIKLDEDEEKMLNIFLEGTDEK